MNCQYCERRISNMPDLNNHSISLTIDYPTNTYYFDSKDCLKSWLELIISNKIR
jgi:hypothetical protein